MSDLDNPTPGFGDPNLPADFNLKGKTSKTPLIVIGVLVVAAIGYFAWSSKKKHDERKLHAAFMETFADIERNELGKKFWACLLGSNIDPAAIQDNLALAQRIEGAFNTDLKGYPSKVREECTPKAKDAKNKLTGANAPAVYDEAIKKYARSLDDLAASLDAWALIAPEQVKEREIGRKVQEAGNAYHAYDGAGKPDDLVVAYDLFFHCAVPGLDAMKDSMEVAKYLFDECKKEPYLERLNTECGKELIAATPGMAPTKGFKAALAKFSGEDREQQAFDDCLRKGRKSKRKDDFEAVGRAWVNNLEAGKELKKIGAEQLKD